MAFVSLPNESLLSLLQRASPIASLTPLMDVTQAFHHTLPANKMEDRGCHGPELGGP